MNHIKNIREIKEGCYAIKCFGDSLCKDCKIRRDYYLKACKQTEKEVEELKEELCQRPPIERCGVCINCKTIDRGFTHKEAINEGEK